MLLPRKVASAPKAPANGKQDIPAAEHQEAENRQEVVVEEEVDPKVKAARLAEVLFQLETCLSNWSLAHNTGLLERLQSAKDGFIDLGDILKSPTLQALATDVSEVQQAFRQRSSRSLELDDSGLRIKRTAISQSNPKQVDWECCSVYLENLPPLSFFKTLPYEVCDWLSLALNGTVETLRFPLLNYQDESDARHVPSVYINTLEFSQSTENLLDKPGKGKRLKLPQGGGPYKRFAIAILSDPTAAQRATTDWAWDRDVVAAYLNKEDCAQSDEEQEAITGPASEGGDPSTKAKDEARRFGLRIMSITEWHRLRAEYLRYQRKLDDLDDSDYEYYSRSRHDRRDDRYASSKSRNTYSSTRKRDRRSDDDVDAEVRGESKAMSSSDWRSARDQTLADEEAVSREMASANFPEACVVRLDNVHVNATLSTIRRLSQNLIQRGGGSETDKVVHVDSPSERVAFVRLSAPGAAVAIKMFLQDEELVMSANDADAVDKLLSNEDSNPEKSASLKATIVTGDEEKAFWARVPVTARQKDNPARHHASSQIYSDRKRYNEDSRHRKSRRIER